MKLHETRYRLLSNVQLEPKCLTNFMLIKVLRACLLKAIRSCITFFSLLISKTLHIDDIIIIFDHHQHHHQKSHFRQRGPYKRKQVAQLWHRDRT